MSTQRVWRRITPASIRCVVRNQFLEAQHGAADVARFDGPRESVESLFEGSHIRAGAGEDADLRMPRGNRGFARPWGLFGHFLAWPHAAESDRNVDVGPIAAQQNHLAGEI